MSKIQLPILPVGSGGGAIPPTINLIWIGGEIPFPHKRAIEAWQAAAPADGITVKVWGNAEVREDLPGGRKLHDLGGTGVLPWRGVADLLRILIVGMYGGIYLDCDSLPLGSFSPYVGERRPWVGAEPRSMGPNVLANGAFGMPPRHPFMAEVMEHAQRALDRGVRNEHFVAGPRAFRNVHRGGWESEVEVFDNFMLAPPGPIESKFLAGTLTVEEARQYYPGAPVVLV